MSYVAFSLLGNGIAEQTSAMPLPRTLLSLKVL